jgi:hypothetical protein
MWIAEEPSTALRDALQLLAQGRPDDAERLGGDDASRRTEAVGRRTAQIEDDGFTGH